jgi:hypothetical protein
MRWLAVVCATLWCLGAVHAVTGDVREPVEGEGFLLVKPQAWSPENAAQVVEFVGYEDRTARGGGGGYYVVRTKRGNERQVMASRVVALVMKPGLPETLAEDAERDALASVAGDFVRLRSRHSQAGVILDRYRAPLVEGIKRFDGGEILIGGEWVSREAFEREQLEGQIGDLRKQIELAPRARDFDWEANRLRRALATAAKTNPRAAEALAELEETHRRRCSLEEQEEILAKVGTASPAEAAALLQRLAELPFPTTDTRLALTMWERAKGFRESAQRLGERMEESHASGGLVVPDDSFREELERERARLAGFVSADPPPPAGMPLPGSLLDAIDAVASGAGELAGLLEEKRLTDAATLLARLEPQAALVGASTRTALNMQRIDLRERIAEFEELKTQGDNAWNNNRKEEALRIYRQALEVAQDDEVAQRVGELENAP